MVEIERRAWMVALVLGLALSRQSIAGQTVVIEVFTGADLAITNSAVDSSEADEALSVEVFEIDALEQLQAELSRGLSSESRLAKGKALDRIEKLTPSRLEPVRQGAVGLLKARAYGIERYPAMVFDGIAVVYGVTDIGEALRLYTKWWEGRGP